MNSTRIREIQIAFDDVGGGAGIVLLHGYPFDRSMWREQIDFLIAAGFRVVAPDLRGLGETKATSEISTMDDMACDVAALMDKLEIDRAVVCGLSMGGYVAFEFVHLFPSRVRALILAGTRAPADNEQEKQVREQQAQRMLIEGMNFVAGATLRKLLAPRTLAEKPEVVARVREMILRSDPQGAAAAQRGMALRRDHSDNLRRINVPTLVIVGREDPIRPVADAQFMHDRIRNSRLEVIEDAAHMTNMEKPEIFNRALVDFVGLIH
ncbi:MAG TPA: alpha/beta fold hydrolase [Pyrinomonadaceae bacterium]|nr:alpha/beta fold hydrolase [Pyrinomonadaceae bacterium]